MRVAILALAASACTPWTELPDVAGPGDIDTVFQGIYQGTATLEVRAFTGPLQVKRELCEVPISIEVNAANPNLLEGEFTCVFDSLGEVSADFMGDASDDLPLIAGTLEARSLDALWDGWFIDTTTLYADMQGTDNQQGLRLEYIGFVQAERSAPLPGGSMEM